ncbi:MAG: AhpC/TSA family protein [Candidatus Thiodiazotropha sp. (ex Dulcina madagascariensis)]|nr:AhpC/TSA family protein [Candidatus Thiodiazotropha sp. (ex Dulcina madagascariensis)]MCU7927413.1 AhpC/TSA family protein [Candidatus Thiodiazotropha sp. (ex Dulcina madagascariensis)]
MSLSEQTKKLTEDFISSQSAENQGIIQGAFTTINATDFGANALREGDQAKSFQLPNNKGGMTALADLLAQGPIVISFYRGGWCPYCNLEFKALNDILPTINELGAKLVGISPELPDNSMSTAERHQLKFEVLSDVGNVIAREYGVIMDVPASMRPLYLQWGLDVPAANGDDTWELPIPATYVIDGDGQVVFAYVNKNYTERSEPSEIVRALKSI